METDVEPVVRISSVESLLQHGLLTGDEKNPEKILISYAKPVAEGTLLAWNDGTSLRISLLDEEKQVRGDVALPDTYIGNVIAISEAVDGWMLLTTATDEYFHTQYYLSKITSNFSPSIASVCLPELCDSRFYNFACTDTTAAVTTDFGCFFYSFDTDFALAGSLAPELYIYDLTESSGKLYAMHAHVTQQMEGVYDMLLSEVDLSTIQLKNTRTIRSGTTYADRIFGDEEGFVDTIAFAFSDGIFLYKTDSSSLQKSFSSSINAGALSVQTIQEIYCDGEGLYRAWGYYNTKFMEYIYDSLVMMDIEPQDHQAKETLRVGVLWISSSPSIYQMCEYINKLNLPFKLELSVYLDALDPSVDVAQIDAAKLAFLRDALSDNPPDLLILTPQERQLLAAQDSLLDLKPFIEASETFDSGEMIPNIWSTVSGDQTCDWIPPYVTLTGTMVSEEYVSELGNGDTDSLQSFLNQYPDVPLVSGRDVSAFYPILTEMINAIYDDIGDPVAEKQSLVELLTLFPVLDQSTNNGGKAYNDIAISVSYLSDFSYYMSLIRNYPWPQTFRGPLGSLDRGLCLAADGGLSISSGTANAEMCWTAIEFMLSEEILDVYGNGIPLRQSSFNSMLLRDATIIKQNDDYVSPISSYEMTYLLQADGIYGEEAPTFNKPLDADIIAQFREDVYTANGWNFFDKDLYALMIEEIDSYLAGDISVEDCADRLIDRIGLWQSEQENG